MSDYFIYVLIAIIVIVGVWFIFAKVLKNKKPKEVTLKDIPIDLEALIHALGGIDNIKESQSQGSKVRFFVENDDLVKVNVLKELGAIKEEFTSQLQKFRLFKLQAKLLLF